MSTEPVIHTMSIWSAAFWRGAGERALKTFAQSFVAVFGVSTAVDLTGVKLDTETWALALVSGLAAAFLSVCMSVAAPTFTAGEAAVQERAQYYAPGPEAVAAQPTPETDTDAAAGRTGWPTGGGSHRADPEHGVEDLEPVVPIVIEADE